MELNGNVKLSGIANKERCKKQTMKNKDPHTRTHIVITRLLHHYSGGLTKISDFLFGIRFPTKQQYNKSKITTLTCIYSPITQRLLFCWQPQFPTVNNSTSESFLLSAREKKNQANTFIKLYLRYLFAHQQPTAMIL